MLQKLKQSLYTPNCLSCGSYFVQNHLFCNYCYSKKIEPRLDLKKHTFGNEKSQKAYSIFDWNPGESDLLSEMVYRFKSNRSVLAWKHFGELAIKALSYEVDISEITYIIPVPGSKNSSIHALVFARIISEMYKKPILQILKKLKSKGDWAEQKQRSKQQRSQNQFALREEFTQNLDYLSLENKRVLLVDDIITTGNSFIQCSEVLGLANPPVLLTLFYRTINSKGVLVS